MKINYSVLWLDDKINDFIEDGWVEKIKNYLSEEGFAPNVLTAAKIDEFNKYLDENTFDLILTDYHMAGKNGDQVVKDIRENNIQTEILFYTAQGGSLKEIGNINRVTFFETTSDHHSEVVEETISLIALTIRKFQHIIAMRGMIMHETSTLDEHTKQILLLYMGSKKAENDEIINSICQKLNEFLTKKMEIVTSVKQDMKYKNLIKDNFLFSAEYKIEAIKYILEKLSLSDFTSDYKAEVSNLRNKFAHAVLETDPNGRQFFKSGEEGLTFDEKLCRTIRMNINKHKKNIDNLETALEKYITN